MAGPGALQPKDPVLFSDVHSFLHNMSAEMARMRDMMDANQVRAQESGEKIRKDLEQERYESRETINKFRYEFDELVHKRVEAVLEGLEEMEQNQKYKDRQQQDQLDKLEAEIGNLKVNLGHVNGKWTSLKLNCQNRKPLCKPKKPRPSQGVHGGRGSLGAACDDILYNQAKIKMFNMVEVMRVRIKGAAQYLHGEEWQRFLRELDTDGSGQIGIDEWFVLCRKKLRLTEADAELKGVFDSLDADNSGEISVEELIEFVGDPAERMRHRLKIAAEAKGTSWAKILKEIDEDGSGQISFLEFTHLCRVNLKLLDKDVQLHHVFNIVDEDHSGEISCEELAHWVEHGR
mmetsp:Transcript_6469/g.13314  ORF Transcript_6469/g.13314 Transcript_6469/m.13314 type:complete len:346 (-) Transcript_6469:123-1160(-)